MYVRGLERRKIKVSHGTYTTRETSLTCNKQIMIIAENIIISSTKDFFKIHKANLNNP